MEVIMALPIYSDIHTYGTITVENTIATQDNKNLILNLGKGHLQVNNIAALDQERICICPMNDDWNSRVDIYHQLRSTPTTGGANYDTIIYSPSGTLSLGEPASPLKQILVETLKTNAISSLNPNESVAIGSHLRAAQGLKVEGTLEVEGELKVVDGGIDGKFIGTIYIDGVDDYYGFYMNDSMPTTLSPNVIYMIWG